MTVPRLSDLRCACGSAEIVALRPGLEPVRSDLPLFDVLLDRGAPDVGRCLPCLLAAFPVLQR